MRSTHVLSVEILAGLLPIRQRLSFLVSVLVKPNDLLMVKLEELHRIWNNSNCLSEWQIVNKSWMVSKTHFLTKFDRHLVDLTFVPKLLWADRFEGHR
jgi:hypothetical protein